MFLPRTSPPPPPPPPNTNGNGFSWCAGTSPSQWSTSPCLHTCTSWASARPNTRLCLSIGPSPPAAWPAAWLLWLSAPVMVRRRCVIVVLLLSWIVIVVVLLTLRCCMRGCFFVHAFTLHSTMQCTFYVNVNLQYYINYLFLDFEI